jgi:inosine-uridine nucleoside N-ribohydrolase
LAALIAGWALPGLLVCALAPAPSSGAAENVILDTDMGELNDDAYALFMLAQSDRTELLGVTVCQGNTWIEEGLAYALGHLERLGRPEVPVLRGAEEPLLGLRGDRLDAEEKLFGKVVYQGAYARPRPASYLALARPPHDGYPKLRPRPGHAVDFIVDEVKRHPGEVTLLAIGPMTNLALAVRKNPEIVPLVRRVVYMAGAFDVPGNTSPAAEFNCWFDPEAARIVFRAPFREQVLVPLDVCEKVFYTREVYQRIASARDTPLVRLFRDLQGPEFARDPRRVTLVWDSLAAALVIRPGLATRLDQRYVDVDATYGPDYGRSLAYGPSDRADLSRPGDFPRGTQKVKILKDINRPAFWDLFISLVTAPPRSPR